MKRSITRIAVLFFAVVLCAAILSPLLLTFVAAEAADIRFIFPSLTGNNGNTVSVSDGQPLTLDLSLSDSYRADTVNVVREADGTNSFRIRLHNHSGATRLVLTCDYVAYTPMTATVSHEITPYAQTEETVIVSASYADTVTALSIRFEGEGALAGTVDLLSFFNLSLYDSSFESEVSVSTCAFSAETGTVEIAGSVSYAATVRFAGETLALFALGPTEDIYLFNKTPVARTGISFSFRFSVPVESAEYLFYRYVIAAVTKSGERVPLSTPYYPSVPAETPEPVSAFKGFHAAGTQSVLSAGVSFETVDVRLDRLLAEQNDGILYAGEHSYFYFDTSYVNDLDFRIRNLKGSGAAVYLRLLVSADANGFAFADYAEDATALRGKALTVNSEAALLTVYAMIDFLTLRYSDSAIGRIDGIVLGRAVNETATYYYSDATNLAACSESYCAAFSIVYGAAVKNLPDLRFVVPLSDRETGDAVSENGFARAYTADLFLYSFLLALKDRYLDPPTFTVMIESDRIPERLSGVPAQGFTSDTADRIDGLLARYGEECAFLDDSYIYCWYPDPTLDARVLKAAYVTQYIALSLRPNVRTFHTDVTDAVSGADTAAREALLYVAESVDTSAFRTVSESVLRTLGVASFTEIFPEFSEYALIGRTVLRPSLTENGYASGIVPKGSYTVWDFSASNDVMGWYAGNRCADLSVLSGKSGKTLTARFGAGDGSEYGDFAHNFAVREDYSFAPLLQFVAAIEGTPQSYFELRVQLIGKDANVTASAIVQAGENHTFFLDLSSMASVVSAIDSIRVGARPLDGNEGEYNICLQSVKMQSAVLTDEELAERVSAVHSRAEKEDDDTDARRDLTVPVLITIVIVLASVAVAIILFMRFRNEKNTQNDTNP